MLLKPANQVEFSEIEGLVTSQTPEGKYIEYKEELPSLSLNEERKEFLADVSSFANASGGHIIYGISENNENGKNTGIPKEIVGLALGNADQEIIRLGQCIQASIKPALHGCQVECVEDKANGKKVVVISIAQSWSPPHMVSVKGSTKFFTRSDRSKSQMDFTEIKRAFLGSEAFEQKLRNFRSERLGKIIAGDSGFNFEPKAALVCHLIPFSKFLSGENFSIAQLQNGLQQLPPPSAAGYSPGVNLDGAYNKSIEDGKITSYVQTFRSGAIEAVDLQILNHSKTEKLFASPSCEKEIFRFFDSAVSYLNRLEQEPPFVFFLSLVNVRGYSASGRVSNPFFRQTFIDRDHVVLPEQVLEDLDLPGQQALKPSIDSIWNALGKESCCHYNEKGNWSPVY